MNASDQSKSPIRRMDFNRTSRHFAPTPAGEEFYRHAAGVVRAADEAESLVRQRVKEPAGVVRFTAAIGTAHFALRGILMNFMQEYPKIQLMEYVTSRPIDLLAENFDVAIRAHSGPLPNSRTQRLRGSCDRKPSRSDAKAK